MHIVLFSFLIIFRKVHKIRNAYLNELWQWIMTATAPVKKQNAARIPKAPSPNHQHLELLKSNLYLISMIIPAYKVSPPKNTSSNTTAHTCLLFWTLHKWSHNAGMLSNSTSLIQHYTCKRHPCCSIYI